MLNIILDVLYNKWKEREGQGGQVESCGEGQGVGWVRDKQRRSNGGKRGRPFPSGNPKDTRKNCLKSHSQW